MKLSDIMRDIADLLDQQVDDQQGGATNTHLKPVQAPEPDNFHGLFNNDD
jgi:hypothetical protein